jgi:hypothetical protein
MFVVNFKIQEYLCIFIISLSALEENFNAIHIIWHKLNFGFNILFHGSLDDGISVNQVRAGTF